MRASRRLRDPRVVVAVQAIPEQRLTRRDERDRGKVERDLLRSRGHGERVAAVDPDRIAIRDDVRQLRARRRNLGCGSAGVDDDDAGGVVEEQTTVVETPACW